MRKFAGACGARANLHRVADRATDCARAPRTFCVTTVKKKARKPKSGACSKIENFVKFDADYPIRCGMA